MEFHKKYDHVGYSYPSVPDPWKPIVEEAIVAIEKETWPTWMPMFFKRWIYYLATGNSIVRVRSNFWYKIYKKFNTGSITQIKDKYAGLRIYGYFNDECEKIVDKAEILCDATCEKCGSTNGTTIVNDRGWYTNLCRECNPNHECNYCGRKKQSTYPIKINSLKKVSDYFKEKINDKKDYVHLCSDCAILHSDMLHKSFEDLP
jgi:hypothetical protein